MTPAFIRSNIQEYFNLSLFLYLQNYTTTKHEVILSARGPSLCSGGSLVRFK